MNIDLKTEPAPQHPGVEPMVDPIRAGLAGGWSVIDASTLDADRSLVADVVIIGTGAGGGVAAETLARAGLKLILVEEGPLRSSTDFRMRESAAYPELYQESAARKTEDKGINILQGRCVGGGTTVNWTSTFRTPATTLEHWARVYDISGFSPSEMAPWFERMEARLNIGRWLVEPNANNSALKLGADRLGIATDLIQRNVQGCWNIGYCGMGCPTNAKQSMLITTLPAALDRGATLVTRARAWKLKWDGNQVVSLHCQALDPRGTVATGRVITVKAKIFVIAAGAIGSPGLLLRSNVPDPHQRIGKRTFLHPTVISAAIMPKPVNAFRGAPQTVYSDHFLDAPFNGPIGYKLEAAPIHPMLVATVLHGYGKAHRQWMARLPDMQVLIALLRDGFHANSTGGDVHLRSDGTPVLDYPITEYVWEGVRRALATMAEIQFAAGAKAVMPVHEQAAVYRSWESAKRAIAMLPMQTLATRVVSAHVMGGAALGSDPRRSVVDLAGRHHHFDNLYVFDGSLFPTSLGSNPQLSIYAVVAKLAADLATKLA